MLYWDSFMQSICKDFDTFGASKIMQGEFQQNLFFINLKEQMLGPFPEFGHSLMFGLEKHWIW